MSLASLLPVIPPNLPAKEGIIVHHVFFWLKNAGDAPKLLEGLKTLRSIPGVLQLWTGIPAGTEKREVVDNSYHVSELIHFDSLATQKEYQDHPVHQKFIADYGHLWDKVLVYDTLMQMV